MHNVFCYRLCCDGQSTSVEVITQEIKSLLNLPDVGFVGVLLYF
jgi:hypothetical protein